MADKTYHIKISTDIHSGSLVLRNYLADIFDKLEQYVEAVYDTDGFHHIVVTVDDAEIQINERVNTPDEGATNATNG